MLERATGQFTIEGQVEDIFGGAGGVARLARVSQTCLFSGALEGESIAEYTAVLSREGERHFQGFQRITGKLGEREGSFVVCVTGDSAKERPRGVWSIVPKSGTGDFLHIRGKGEFFQTAGSAGAYTLEFDLRKPRKARATESPAEVSATLTPADPVAVDDGIEQVMVAIETPPVKPPRRRGAKSASPDTLDTPAEDRSPRRAKGPATATEPPAFSAPTPAAEQPKRTRKRGAAVEMDGVTTATMERAATSALSLKTRRTRKQTDVSSDHTEVPSPGPAEPSQSKPRAKRTKTAEPEPVIETSPAPEPSTRKRVRKPATAPVPEPSIDLEPITAAKRGSRKKSVSTPPPPPLTIIAKQPARVRKAKAA